MQKRYNLAKRGDSMFIYISVFVLILLVLIIAVYIYLPNLQFTLSFNKKTFRLTVITLSIAFLYFLGFGIYDKIKDHQETIIVKVDGTSHLVNGIEGKVLLLEDQKVHANRYYTTWLFTWKKLQHADEVLTVSSTGERIVYTDSIYGIPSYSKEPISNQIREKVGAKYMYKVSLHFPSRGIWKVSFGDENRRVGPIHIEVYQ
jgi:hypothetical protein